MKLLITTDPTHYPEKHSLWVNSLERVGLEPFLSIMGLSIWYHLCHYCLKPFKTGNEKSKQQKPKHCLMEPLRSNLIHKNHTVLLTCAKPFDHLPESSRCVFSSISRQNWFQWELRYSYRSACCYFEVINQKSICITWKLISLELWTEWDSSFVCVVRHLISFATKYLKKHVFFNRIMEFIGKQCKNVRFFSWVKSWKTIDFYSSRLHEKTNP